MVSMPNVPRVLFVLLFCQMVLTQLCRAEEAVDPYDVLYDVIMTRHGPDGKTYGKNSAVPLIWNDSSYLLNGDTHKKFIDALDAFSAVSQQEIEVYSDVKRALLQRHLWAVFDWATVRRAPSWDEPQELKATRFKIQRKIAALMKRLALSEAEILALPNPMKAAAKSGGFPQNYDPDDCLKPFLPADLFDEEGPWVCLRRTRAGLPAQLHSEFEEWRSTFLVFMRLPGGRKETLGYLEKLNSFREPLIFNERGPGLNPKTPQFPVGTQFALVEQAMLISDQGEPTLSPLIYNVQLRAYVTFDFKDLETLKNRTQALAEFVMQPRQLMQGKPAIKALGRDERHHTTFFSNDPFQASGRSSQDPHLGLRSCMQCHMSKGILSVNSRSRIVQLGPSIPARFREGKPSTIATSTAARKKQHYTWGVLEVLWRNEAKQFGVNEPVDVDRRNTAATQS